MKTYFPEGKKEKEKEKKKKKERRINKKRKKKEKKDEMRLYPMTSTHKYTHFFSDVFHITQIHAFVYVYC